ncbi:heme ABC transporter ATP-binding protein [Motilibacter aurantiacus]|uniref:heme ABC transporter ATP-binding protein n=1 Tax=Motilibacter aurantiacus TaxID=2714955 RepID=UPI0014099810|nr:heme ABC transporter ATP-binding protein [Motilibacter aurantiacus]NHC45152.1 heme ABC transporter ATP-binding protein [Motilibacter aurantiacus]
MRGLLGRLAPRPDLPARPEPGTVAAAVRGAGVRLGSRTVLDGVTLDVRSGEVLALVGPNGAGKSTLLGVLSGDRVPDTGEVELLARPVGEWSTAQLSRRRAVLPQQVALAFPFSVAEVIRMGRRPWAGTDAEDEDDRVVAQVMAQTDVDRLAGRGFPTLSGGERGRVALARVLAQQTPVLLLDEPTAALDLHHVELVLRVARERAARGDAVVIVLHDLATAAAHADRVAVLAEGAIAACGPPAEVFTAELLSHVYTHPVEVLVHPRTGAPLVLPLR